MKREYQKRETLAVDKFFQSLKESSKAEGATFDSAAAVDFVEDEGNQSLVPENLKAVYDECEDPKVKGAVTRAILDGCSAYEAAHGVEAPADLIETAIHNAYATTEAAHQRYKFDSVIQNQASNAHSDPLSLQPNRAVVAILSAFTEGIPFAHYLPADIGSNEAKLAIMTHRTGDKDYGQYKADSMLDGIFGGDPYLSTARVHSVNPASESGDCDGKITKIQLPGGDKCDPDAGDLKLLRGRTIVYVNGFEAARETGSGARTSPISGTFKLGEQEYVIGGSIDTDTGAFHITTSPAMPEAAVVTVEGFIDLEREPILTPSIVSNVETYSLFANPWRAYTRQSMDATTQMSNELGLDPYSESVMAIQTQFAQERHYNALAKGMRLAKNSTETFDFKDARQYQDAARSEVWRDLSYALGVLDQRMAEQTLDHGISHLYVGKRVMAQLKHLPSTMFTPSGITSRPGIYRLGRLFGRYEVYYTPKIVGETENSAQILCIGRASNVALNPIVLGDAVAPTVIPLAVGEDLRRGAGYYARNFTCVNPYRHAAAGFALLNVTNM